MTATTEQDVFKLILKRKQSQYEAYLGFTCLPVHALLFMKDQYLQNGELDFYEMLISDRKRKSFLQGRYIAKKILANYLQEDDLKSIRIKSGVFNQPIVVYPKAAPPMISIAHTSACAACLVFSDEHPMGLDLEPISETSKEDISSQITTHEKKLNDLLQEEESDFYTRLWSVKEALSKVLKTGLMTPFETYEIETMEPSSSESLTISTFTNFSQYKAISFQWRNNICSIVLPKETECIFSMQMLAL